MGKGHAVTTRRMVGKMTAKELLRLRRHLKLTQVEMAEELGVSLPMYQHYEKGRWPLSKPVEKLAVMIKNG